MNAIFIMLTLFMIGAALVAVFTRWLISSVVAVGAVGFLVAISFLLMGAPDLAITQIVVEVITLVILVRATIDRDTTVSAYRAEKASVVIMGAITVILLVLSVSILRMVHPFGQPLMPVSAHYLAHGLQETGAANIVTSVLMGYRAYDTLGEATVIFAAIVGALVIIRKHKQD